MMGTQKIEGLVTEGSTTLSSFNCHRQYRTHTNAQVRSSGRDDLLGDGRRDRTRIFQHTHRRRGRYHISKEGDLLIVTGKTARTPTHRKIVWKRVLSRRMEAVVEK